MTLVIAVGVVDGADRASGASGAWAVPIAVVYKFFDDQGNYLAAIITYYAFIAIFPLLLLASSIFGFVLQGNPELQERVLNSALGQFPIIGDQLGRPRGCRARPSVVVVGSLAASTAPRPGPGDPERDEHRLVGAAQQPPQPASCCGSRACCCCCTAGLAVLAISVVSAIGSNTEVFGAGVDATIGG